MSATRHGLGGRLALFDPDTLTATQRELFDQVLATWLPWAQRSGFAAATDDGRLIGPFNPSLLNPNIATAFFKLQTAEQQYTRQVMILTVGAVWWAPYELYAHCAVARRAGLDESVVAELAAGGLPESLTDGEKTAHRLARALSTTHRVDDRLYRQAEQTLSAAGVFEVVMLTGYLSHGVRHPARL